MSLTEPQKNWLRTQHPEHILKLVLGDSGNIDINELRAFAAEDRAFEARWRLVEEQLRNTPDPREIELFNDLVRRCEAGDDDADLDSQLNAFVVRLGKLPWAASYVDDLRTWQVQRRERKEYDYIRRQVIALLNDPTAIPSQEILDALADFDCKYNDYDNIPDGHINEVNLWIAELGRRRSDAITEKWHALFDGSNVADVDSLKEFCERYGSEPSFAALADDTLWETVTHSRDALAGARSYKEVYPAGRHNAEYLRMEFDAVVDADGAAVSPEAISEFSRKFSTEADYSLRVDDALWAWAMKQPDIMAAARVYNQLNHNVGRHSGDVARLNNLLTQWNDVDKTDVDEILEFKEQHRNVPFQATVDAALQAAKTSIIDEMLTDPVSFSEADIKQYIQDGVFTEEELRGIFGDEDGHIVRRMMNASALTERIAIPMPDEKAITSGFDSTDIVLFGMPRSGKTCLHMGLLCNERLDFVSDDWSGQYAQALNEYADVGVAPAFTVTGFVSVIKCKIKRDSKRWIDFNLVDMAGEDFVNNIVQVNAAADTTSSFADMGKGAAELIANEREKVLFVMIDPTVKGHSASVQKKVVKKLLDILQNPVNSGLTSRVRGLHFIITKADVLPEPRLDNALKIVHSYLGEASREQIIEFCRENGINNSNNKDTNGRPRVFCFSLGKFYPANTFEYNPKDSDIILSFIGDYVTALNRGRSRVVDFITKPSF
ncbi:MAG: hypothetical protein K2M55_06675 [Muribaculaceae bacterium]|nr:hypothetical protein [Muribaculaceae bacterium]